MAISTTNVGAGNVTTYISSGDSAVTFMSLCNHSAGNITVEIYIVADGDSAGVNNLLITDLEIIAGDTYILYHGAEKIIFANNDAIVVSASTDNVVSAITSYMEV